MSAGGKGVTGDLEQLSLSLSSQAQTHGTVKGFFAVSRQFQALVLLSSGSQGQKKPHGPMGM